MIMLLLDEKVETKKDAPPDVPVPQQEKLPTTSQGNRR
jgi:hypothetical protein